MLSKRILLVVAIMLPSYPEYVADMASEKLSLPDNSMRLFR